MLETLSYPFLALVCFISASIYPLASEAFVVSFVLAGFDKITVFIVASLSNTLGSLSTYLLGFFASKFFLEKYLKKSIQKAEKYKKYCDKYGFLLAFFAFLPIVGDIFVLALVINKYPVLKASIFIFLGKAFRYFILLSLL